MGHQLLGQHMQVVLGDGQRGLFLQFNMASFLDLSVHLFLERDLLRTTSAFHVGYTPLSPALGVCRV